MATLSKQELESQMTLLVRGCEAVYAAPELAARLEAAAAAGRQLRVKFGMDPTAPDIHLGHTVVLRKMRQFQDLGHKAVLIIGDYTARVGDPSGANKTRPMLTPQQIEANAATYIRQAGKVLDTSPEKLEIRHNSEWLAKWTFADILKFASQMTVARMMERDTFEIRYKAGIPIGVHEFLYPLMQGYDSICVQADVELGGSDQTFNCLVGRDFQENAGQARQVVVIMPILVGLDGTEKMSKSKGNYIGVAESPKDMFGKVMSIPDTLMANYFTLLTELPAADIQAMTDPAKTHPRAAKAELGKRIVAQYHGAASGEEAAAEFDRVFSQKQVPAEMPEVRVPAGGENIVKLIVSCGFTKSTSDARRLIAQGAVALDDRVITDIEEKITPRGGEVLRVGKRRFGRIVVG
jgi:tyrosyl-tRNA synthetase